MLLPVLLIFFGLASWWHFHFWQLDSVFVTVLEESNVTHWCEKSVTLICLGALGSSNILWCTAGHSLFSCPMDSADVCLLPWIQQMFRQFSKWQLCLFTAHCFSVAIVSLQVWAFLQEKRAASVSKNEEIFGQLEKQIQIKIVDPTDILDWCKFLAWTQASDMLFWVCICWKQLCTLTSQCPWQRVSNWLFGVMIPPHQGLQMLIWIHRIAALAMGLCLCSFMTWGIKTRAVVTRGVNR